MSRRPDLSEPMPFTPKMRDALGALLGDQDLAFATTDVGRPTKQRLARWGLARYLTPKDWDGPMAITAAGRSVAAKRGVTPRPMRFLIESGSHGDDAAWYREGETTIAELVQVNAEDEYVVADMVPVLRALRHGASHVFNLGAGGLSRFTRIA